MNTQEIVTAVASKASMELDQRIKLLASHVAAKIPEAVSQTLREQNDAAMLVRHTSIFVLGLLEAEFPRDPETGESEMDGWPIPGCKEASGNRLPDHYEASGNGGKKEKGSFYALVYDGLSLGKDVARKRKAIADKASPYNDMSDDVRQAEDKTLVAERNRGIAAVRTAVRIYINMRGAEEWSDQFEVSYRTADDGSILRVNDPIHVYDKIGKRFRNFSPNGFAALDLKKTEAGGGTWSAFINSGKSENETELPGEDEDGSEKLEVSSDKLRDHVIIVRNFFADVKKREHLAMLIGRKEQEDFLVDLYELSRYVEDFFPRIAKRGKQLADARLAAETAN